MATYNEIRAQIATLEKQAEEAREAEIEAALTTVRALIREHNLSIADIGKRVFANGTGKKMPGGKPPKYRDPETGATWSGYGKRPRWISAAMKEGRGDEYLIAKGGGKAAKPAPAKKQAAKKTPARPVK
jgi:DNA-binding protein H-NS